MLHAEISGLRDSVLALTRHSTNDSTVLEIIGLHDAQRLEFAGPIGNVPDRYYQISLTHRDQLSARSMIPVSDPSIFLRFFDDLAQHDQGWQGEKKVSSDDGVLAITCTYEGKKFRPEVSMDVYCAIDAPSFDPYWAVQLHLDIQPESLNDLAARARIFFGPTGDEPSNVAD